MKKCEICGATPEAFDLLCSSCRETIRRLVRISFSAEEFVAVGVAAERQRGGASAIRANWWG